MIFLTSFSSNTINFILENIKVKDLSTKVFLEELRRILVVELNVEDFIKRIVPTTLSVFSGIAIYDYSQKTVFLDMNHIILYLRYLMDSRLLTRITDSAISFKFYQAIVHEFLHAYQDLCCLNFSDKQSFLEVLRDSVLIHDGYSLNNFKTPSIASIINGDRLYRKHHDLFPGERHADLTSYDILLPIFNKVFSNEDITLQEFKNVFLKSCSKNYKFGSNFSYPLESFYNVIGCTERLDIYDFSEYESRQKLIGGMPLTMPQFYKEKSLILSS